MTRIVRLIVLTFFLTLAARGGETESLLTGIRYNVRGDGSRLGLTFSRPAAYIAARTKEGIVFHFSHAGVAPRPGAARIAFTDGLISGVTVDRLRQDSLRVTLSLRPRAEVQIPQSGTVTELMVVARKSVSREGGGIAERVALLSSAVRASEAPSLPGPLPEARGGVTLSALRDSGAVPRASEEPVLSGARLLLAAALAAVAAATTLLGMAFAVRKMRRGERPASGKGEEKLEISSVIEIPKGLSVRRGAGEEPFTEPGEERETEERAELEAVTGAFRREPAEMELARRLRNGSAVASSTARAAAIAASQGGPARRRSEAKRLGVGVGEVELAARLREVADEHSGKGEA